MGKEKMIQEMVNGLEHCDVDNDCDSCVKKNYPCYIYDWCKTLVEKGYRKVPEGSVALTKEEYEKLKALPEKVHNEMDERMKEELAIEKRMGEKKAERARKETAKEIYFDYEKNIKAMYGAFDVVDAYSILEELKEICEKNGADFNDGVEVEE